MPQPLLLERRVQVRELHAKGLNDSEIATKMGLSVPWVNRIRRSLGLPGNHKPHRGPTKWDPAKACALHSKGLNDRQVAEKLGISRESVQKWRRVQGLRAHG